MAAPRATAAGGKRIPRRAATAEEVFRVIAVAAKPAARSVRSPFTARATNAAELVRCVADGSFLGRFPWLQSFLKEQERYREM